MTEEDKIKAIAEMHAKMKESGIVPLPLGDNIESFVEGILPNISLGQRGFQDLPYIAQRIDVGLDGDQIQVLPLNDAENNFYYAVVKHKKRLKPFTRPLHVSCRMDEE